jgi:hypothetical protein
MHFSLALPPFFVSISLRFLAAPLHIVPSSFFYTLLFHLHFVVLPYHKANKQTVQIVCAHFKKKKKKTALISLLSRISLFYTLYFFKLIITKKIEKKRFFLLFFSMTKFDKLIESYTITLSSNGLLALSSLWLLFYSILQLFKLWSQGSKLSNRKRVFLSVNALLLLRCVSFTLSLWPSLSSSWFYPVYRLCYLAPLSLLFRASSWLLLNWFELFQKEKLRKKLPRLVRRLSSGELTPVQRRRKGYVQQKSLKITHEKFNSAMSIVVCVLWLMDCVNWLWRGEQDWGYSMPSFAEAVLALCCMASLCVMCEYAFRRLASIALAAHASASDDASKSSKLKRHSVLTVSLSLSALLHMATVLLLYAVQPEAAAWWHAALRTLELLHCALLISMLRSPSLSLKAPFPDEPKNITQDWLTSVLRENGHIRSSTTVVAFWSENLKGGCHFKVSRVNLRYSVEKADDPCKTVVVKLLYWDKPLLERLWLHAKYRLNWDDREVMYLQSYRIEARFYKRQVNEEQRGLKVPDVYYNLEDCFNNRFSMVCQDLSALDDGQPNGYSRAYCELALSRLAEFHAGHWGIERPDPRTEPDAPEHGWHQAGYWTGDKREANKQKVRSCWKDCLINFPQLRWRQSCAQLGTQLLDMLDYVAEQFRLAETKPYRTLCHGDFKISSM